MWEESDKNTIYFYLSKESLQTTYPEKLKNDE